MTPTLTDIIKRWLQENNAHHSLDVNEIIACNCTSLYRLNSIVVNNYVYVTRPDKPAMSVVEKLSATDPKFFNKFQYYLEQSCDKRSL